MALLLPLAESLQAQETRLNVEGFVTPPRFSVAALLKRAGSGDPVVAYELGRAYEPGTGVPQSFADAAHWYEVAAHRGHPGAQNLLGTLYLFGQGVAQSEEQAARWFMRAAASGYAPGRYNLGSM